MDVVKFVKSKCLAVRDWAVPPLCLMCDVVVDVPGGCCSRCWQSVRFIARPYCEVLGVPFSHDLGKGALCAGAIADPPPFERARSAVLYDDQIRRLVSRFKYSDRLEFAPWMAKWMVTAGTELFEDNPIVIPVPLYGKRLIARRYNQSAELARHLAEYAGLRYSPEGLVRVRNTKQQVGLTGKERESNVQGAFRVPVEQKGLLKGQSVLLIDDVYTTGATVKTATRALKRVGAGPVEVLTFARVETFDI